MARDNFLGMCSTDPPMYVLGMGMYVVARRGDEYGDGHYTLVRYDEDRPNEREKAMKEHIQTLNYKNRR